MIFVKDLTMTSLLWWILLMCLVSEQSFETPLQEESARWSDWTPCQAVDKGRTVSFRFKICNDQDDPLQHQHEGCSGTLLEVASRVCVPDCETVIIQRLLDDEGHLQSYNDVDQNVAQCLQLAAEQSMLRPELNNSSLPNNRKFQIGTQNLDDIAKFQNLTRRKKNVTVILHEFMNGMLSLLNPVDTKHKPSTQQRNTINQIKMLLAPLQQHPRVQPGQLPKDNGIHDKRRPTLNHYHERSNYFDNNLQGSHRMNGFGETNGPGRVANKDYWKQLMSNQRISSHVPRMPDPNGDNLERQLLGLRQALKKLRNQPVIPHSHNPSPRNMGAPNLGGRPPPAQRRRGRREVADPVVIASVEHVEVNGSIFRRVGELLRQKEKQIRGFMQGAMDTDFAEHFQRIGQAMRRFLSDGWNKFVEIILPDTTYSNATFHNPERKHSLFDRLRGLLDIRNGFKDESSKLGKVLTKGNNEHTATSLLGQTDDLVDVQKTSETASPTDLLFQSKPTNTIPNMIEDRRHSSSKNDSPDVQKDNASSLDPPQPPINDAFVLELRERIKREDFVIPTSVPDYTIPEDSQPDLENLLVEFFHHAASSHTLNSFRTLIHLSKLGRLARYVIEHSPHTSHTAANLDNIRDLLESSDEVAGIISLLFSRYTSGDFTETLSHERIVDRLETLSQLSDVASQIYSITKMKYLLSTLSALIQEDDIFGFLKQIHDIQNEKHHISHYREILRNLASLYKRQQLNHLPEILSDAIETLENLYTTSSEKRLLESLQNLTGFHFQPDITRYRHLLRDLIIPLKYKYKAHDLLPLVDRLLETYQDIIKQDTESEWAASFKTLLRHYENIKQDSSGYRAFLKDMTTLKNNIHDHQDLDVLMGQLQFLTPLLGQSNKNDAGTPATSTASQEIQEEIDTIEDSHTDINTFQNETLHSLKRRQVSPQVGTESNSAFLNNLLDLSRGGEQEVTNAISNQAVTTLFDIIRASRRKDEPLRTVKGMKRFHRLTSRLESYQNMNHIAELLLAIGKLSPLEMKEILAGVKNSGSVVAFLQKYLLGKFYEKYRDESTRNPLLSFLKVLLHTTPNIRSYRNDNRLLELATFMSDHWYHHRISKVSLYHLLKKLQFIQKLSEKHELLDFLKLLRGHGISTHDGNSAQALANLMARFISRGRSRNNVIVGNLLRLLGFPLQEGQNKTVYDFLMDIVQSLDYIKNNANRIPEMDQKAFHSLVNLITTFQSTSFNPLTIEDFFQDLGILGKMSVLAEQLSPLWDFLDSLLHLVPNTKFKGSTKLAMFTNIMDHARILHHRKNQEAFDHLLKALRSLQEDNVESFYPVLQNMTMLDLLQLPETISREDLGKILDLANLTGHTPSTNATDLLPVFQQMNELWTQLNYADDQKTHVLPLLYVIQSLRDEKHLNDHVQELQNLVKIMEHFRTVSSNSMSISNVTKMLRFIFDINYDQSVVENGKLNFIDALELMLNNQTGMKDVSPSGWNKYGVRIAQIISGAAPPNSTMISEIENMLKYIYGSNYDQAVGESNDHRLIDALELVINSQKGLGKISPKAWNEYGVSIAQVLAEAASERLENTGDFDKLLRTLFHQKRLLADITGLLGTHADERLADAIRYDLEILKEISSPAKTNVSQVEENFLHVLQQMDNLWEQLQDSGDKKILLHPWLHMIQSMSDDSHLHDNVQELLNLTKITEHLKVISSNSTVISNIKKMLQYIFQSNYDQISAEKDKLNLVNGLEILMEHLHELKGVSPAEWKKYDAVPERPENTEEFDRLLKILFDQTRLRDFPERSNQLADVIGSLGMHADEQLANGIGQDLDILNVWRSLSQLNISNEEENLLHVLQQTDKLWTQLQGMDEQKIALDPLLHLIQSLSDENKLEVDGQELQNLTKIMDHLNTISTNSTVLLDIANMLQYIFEGNYDQPVMSDEHHVIDSLAQFLNSQRELTNISKTTWNEYGASLAQIITEAAIQGFEYNEDFDELLRTFFNPKRLQDFPEISDRLVDIIGLLGMHADEKLAKGIRHDLEVLHGLGFLVQSNVSKVEALTKLLLELDALHSDTYVPFSMSFVDSLLHIIKSTLTSDQGTTNLQFLAKLIQDSSERHYKGQFPAFAQFLEDLPHLHVTPSVGDHELSNGYISYTDFLQLLDDDEFSEDEIAAIQDLANLTNRLKNGNTTDDFIHLMKLFKKLQSLEDSENEPEVPIYSLLNMFSDLRGSHNISADMMELRGILPFTEYMNAPESAEVVNEITKMIDSISSSHSLTVIKLIRFLRDAVRRGYYTSPADIDLLQVLSAFASEWQSNLTESAFSSFKNLLKGLDKIGWDQKYVFKDRNEALVNFLKSASGKDDWNPQKFIRLSQFADLLENVPAATNFSQIQRLMMDIWGEYSQREDQDGIYVGFLSDVQSGDTISKDNLEELNRIIKIHADSFKQLDPSAIHNLLSFLESSRDEQLIPMIRFLIFQEFPESFDSSEILQMQNLTSFVRRLLPYLTDKDIEKLVKLFAYRKGHEERVGDDLRLMGFLALKDALSANRSLDMLRELKSLTKRLSLFKAGNLQYDDMAYNIEHALSLFDTKNAYQGGDILHFINTLSDEAYQPTWPWSNSVLRKMNLLSSKENVPQGQQDNMLRSIARIFGQSHTEPHEPLMSLLAGMKDVTVFQPSSIDAVAELDRHENIKKWTKESTRALHSYLDSINDVLGLGAKSEAASFLDFVGYADSDVRAKEYSQAILDLKNLSGIIPNTMQNTGATTSVFEEVLKLFSPKTSRTSLLAFVDALQEMFNQPEIDVSNDPMTLNKFDGYFGKLPLPMTRALQDIHDILTKTEEAKSYLDYMQETLSSITENLTDVLPDIKFLGDLEKYDLFTSLPKSSSPSIDKATLRYLYKLLGQKTSQDTFAVGLEDLFRADDMNSGIDIYQTSDFINNYQKDIFNTVAFQQYFGDLSDIVNILGQYSALKENIQKPGLSILDLFEDLQEFPNETFNGKLFEEMHTLQTNMTGYTKNIEITIKLLESIFGLTSPDVMNAKETLLDAFEDIAIHTGNLTKEESLLMYQRIADNFEAPYKAAFGEFLGNISSLLWSQPEAEKNEEILLDMIDSINLKTITKENLTLLYQTLREKFEEPLEPDFVDLLGNISSLLWAQPETENDEILLSMLGSLYWKTVIPENSAILYRQIAENFKEPLESAFVELLGNISSLLWVNPDSEILDKILLGILERMDRITNKSHEIHVIRTIFDKIQENNGSWNIAKQNTSEILRIFTTLLIPPSNKITEKEKGDLFDLLYGIAHVSYEDSQNDTISLFQLIRDKFHGLQSNFSRETYEDLISILNSASRENLGDKLFLHMVDMLMALGNDSHQMKLVQSLFDEMVSRVPLWYNETMSRIMGNLLVLQEKKRISPLLDFIQKIMRSNKSETVNNEENTRMFKVMMQHVPKEVSLQELTRYLEHIQDLDSHRSEDKDILDLFDKVGLVSKEVSRNDTVTLYELIQDSFQELPSNLSLGTMEDLISILDTASRENLDDRSFLPLIEGLTGVGNESHRMKLVQSLFQDTLSRIRLRYNRTMKGIIEDLLLLQEKNRISPLGPLDFIRNIMTPDISAAESDHDNMRMIKNMMRHVPKNVSLPEFTRYLENIQDLIVIRNKHKDLLDLIQKVGRVNEEVVRNDTIRLYQQITSNFYEIPSNLSRQQTEEMFTILDTAHRGYQNDKLFLRLLERLSAIRNDSRKMEKIQKLFQDMVSAMSVSYNQTMSSILDSIILLREHGRMLPVVDFLQKIVTRNDSHTGNKQDNMEVYNAMKHQIPEDISFHEFARYFAEFGEVIDERMKPNDVIQLFENIAPESENASRNETVNMFEQIQGKLQRPPTNFSRETMQQLFSLLAARPQEDLGGEMLIQFVDRLIAVANDSQQRKMVHHLFHNMMSRIHLRYSETMSRILYDIIRLHRKRRMHPVLDLIQTILATNLTHLGSEEENIKLYRAINRHVPIGFSFKDLTRYIDNIRDMVDSRNKPTDLLDVLEKIYPVGENASRNDTVGLYKLITATFQKPTFSRGPVEELISLLRNAHRKRHRQRFPSSKAQDMLFLRLFNKMRILRNASHQRSLLRKTLSGMVSKVSIKYNRTVSSILEDILLLHQNERMSPIMEFLQKLGASNESKIGNGQANMKMFDEMSRRVPPVGFQLPDFTQFLKDLQYFGEHENEPRAPESEDSMLVTFFKNSSYFRYLSPSKSNWVDFLHLIANTSAPEAENVIKTYMTLLKQSRKSTAFLTFDQGTELINILKNISHGKLIHRDKSSWSRIYGSLKNASSHFVGKHLTELMKHLFGEVRNETNVDISDGMFLDMIEGLRNESLWTSDRVLLWMEVFRAIKRISLGELRNTLGSLLEIVSRLDEVLEQPQPYPTPAGHEEILNVFQNMTEWSIPLQKSASINIFSKIIHRKKQTEDELYPVVVKGNRRFLLQLDSLFNPEEFERKKREHVMLEFLLKIPRLLNASELDKGDLAALQEVNDFDYFDYSIYEERPLKDNSDKGAVIDRFLGVMEKLVGVDLNVWNNSFPFFLGQPLRTSLQRSSDLQRMYYSLAKGIRMMSKAFHGIISMIQNPTLMEEKEPTTTTPERNDLDKFLTSLGNVSHSEEKPDLTLLQTFSKLTIGMKNSTGSGLGHVMGVLSSLLDPQRKETDEWRGQNRVPIDQWSEWTLWSTCSVSCGYGHHVRRRTCSISIEGLLIASDQCTGAAEEVTVCQVECHEGSWTDWSSWSLCDNRCGVGNQTRSRLCTWNQAESVTTHPINHFCHGPSDEKKTCREYDFDECSIHEIFVPGTWSEWTTWTKCPDICKGYRERQRSCHPLNETKSTITRMKRDEGLLCEGDAKQNISCAYSWKCWRKMHPIITAVWTEWSPWSQCDNRCGVGNQTRSRRCRLTHPQETMTTHHHHNHSCSGNSEEKRSCSEYDFDECTLHDIFVPGTWTEWSEWSECSENCTGHRNRHRLCHPLNEQTSMITRMKRDKGLLCEGNSTQNATCKSSECSPPATAVPKHQHVWAEGTSAPIIVSLSMIGFVLFLVLIIWYFATRRRRGKKPYRTDRGNSAQNVFQSSGKRSFSENSRRSSSARSILSWPSRSKESSLYSDQTTEESARLLDNEEAPPVPPRFCPYRERSHSAGDISAEWLWPWEMEGDDWAALDFERHNAANVNFDVYMEVDESAEEPQTFDGVPTGQVPTAADNQTGGDQENKMNELEKSAEAWFD